MSGESILRTTGPSNVWAKVTASSGEAALNASITGIPVFFSNATASPADNNFRPAGEEGGEERIAGRLSNRKN